MMNNGFRANISPFSITISHQYVICVGSDTRSHLICKTNEAGAPAVPLLFCSHAIPRKTLKGCEAAVRAATPLFGWLLVILGVLRMICHHCVFPENLELASVKKGSNVQVNHLYIFSERWV